MPQEVLRSAQLFDRRCARGEGHLVTPGGKWSDDIRPRIERWRTRICYALVRGFPGALGIVRSSKESIVRHRARSCRRLRLPASTDRIANIRLGLQPGDDLLHLQLALVTCRFQDLPMVLGREAWSEQPHGREMQGAATEHLQNDRESSRCLRRFGPIVGLVLREMQELRAVDVHTRAAVREVQVAILELHQVMDELRGHLTTPVHQELHSSTKLIVRKRIQFFDPHGCTPSLVRAIPLYHEVFEVIPIDELAERRNKPLRGKLTCVVKRAVPERM